MRSVKVNYREEDDIEVDDTMDNRNERSRKKKIHLVSDERRRPVKNWKKVWSDHSTDYDEVDEFYGKSN